MGAGTRGSAAAAACTPCRTVKMKCTREPDSMDCNRCTRKKLTCLYQSHRRGRKPGTKLRPKSERFKTSPLPTLLSNAQQVTESTTAPPPPPPHPASETTTKTEPGRPLNPLTQDDGYQGPNFSAEPIRPISSSDTPATVKPVSGPQKTRTLTESLAPFALLRKSATPGNYTIANILNMESESQGPGEDGVSHSDADDCPIDVNDPINEGLIGLPTAQGLYDNFFKYQNPLVCQFDPVLHTMRYIRSRSSFLFTTLLSAAAKIFCPSLYSKLYDHREKLLHNILGSGGKSSEIVQGICLMTHWKEPSDSRAWMFIGYAIRACLEMGWHKLQPTNLDDPKQSIVGAEAEMAIRERRNKERTWFMLFVYDRSVGIQLGKPSMIQLDPVIRNVENWHRHVYSVPGVDETIVAFTQLRSIGFGLPDLFWLDPATASPEAVAKDQYILRLFNDDLDRWESRWHRTLDEADASPCQRFLVRFYGRHLRLLFHSFRLQLSIASGSVSKEALWVCYASALEMVRLIIERLGASSYLYYSQDSLHVMVAYAAVVAIKILLSFPGELPSEAEKKILDVFMEASEYFGRQCSNMNTSCYYQSRFLANVVAQYRQSKEKEESLASGKKSIKQKQDNHGQQSHVEISTDIKGQFLPRQQQQQMAHQAQTQAQAHLPSHNNAHHLLDSQMQSNSLFSSPKPALAINNMHTAAANEQLHNTRQQQQHQQQEQQQQVNLQTHTQLHSYPHPQDDNTHQHSGVPNGIFSTSTPPSGSSLPASNKNYNNIYDTTSAATTVASNNSINDSDNFEAFIPVDRQNNYAFASFTDNGAWEYLFAHAGFNITNGAFLPDLERS